MTGEARPKVFEHLRLHARGPERSGLNGKSVEAIGIGGALTGLIGIIGALAGQRQPTDSVEIAQPENKPIPTKEKKP